MQILTELIRIIKEMSNIDQENTHWFLFHLEIIESKKYFWRTEQNGWECEMGLGLRLLSAETKVPKSYPLYLSGIIPYNHHWVLSIWYFSALILALGTS